ncbi:MAG TPA: tRNA epoxyqueuosine(34) reductase QueG [Phycisphaerae bacterium]|nr:tRNA epoxyqueuosine(34) reductase QueG [Phycisphaerae bacterium]
MSEPPAQLAALVKAIAAELGFERSGIAAAGPIPRGDFFRRWLANGHAGTMGYLHRHADSRVDVRAWLPWARSVIVVALNYRQAAPAKPDDEPRGRVAMYAWGEDYHVVMREKLHKMVERLRVDSPVADAATPPRFQICVDTSAIIERELAMAAGVGWIGKNTMAIDPEIGSYFFLGEIITDLELQPDAPAVDHCGSCTRCLEACPTQAFPAPYAMDASRCISYLTIEHRSAIDPALAEKTGDWIYGCDVCQDVCPHNHRAPEAAELRFAGSPAAEVSGGVTPADSAFPGLSVIEAWDDAAYRRSVTGKASDRATLAMWQRNAANARENLTDL